MDYEVIKRGENSFYTSFHVPSCFHGSIIGQKGATRKRLEMETKTLIKVPNRGSQDPVMVTGQCERDVVAARKKIEDIVSAARRRNDITHFLSIPCCTSGVKEVFGKFKETVLTELAIEGVTEVFFQVPEKLHITLTGMVLMDDEERKIAKNILHDEESAVKDILGEFGDNIEFHISGIDCMTDDHEAAGVLFAKIHSEAVQKIADHLERAYRKHSISKNRDRESVKLHMTIMNVAFDKDESGRFKKNKFNAKPILEKFHELNFGTIPLTEVHLSQRKAYDDKGYYKATTKLTF